MMIKVEYFHILRDCAMKIRVKINEYSYRVVNVDSYKANILSFLLRIYHNLFVKRNIIIFKVRNKSKGNYIFREFSL